jgi:hypothetical protein
LQNAVQQKALIHPNCNFRIFSLVHNLTLGLTYTYHRGLTNSVLRHEEVWGCIDHVFLILGVCILLRAWDLGDGGLFRLRNVPIVGYFYYLILLKLLHVSAVRQSWNRNILATTGMLRRWNNPPPHLDHLLLTTTLVGD